MNKKRISKSVKDMSSSDVKNVEAIEVYYFFTEREYLLVCP